MNLASATHLHLIGIGGAGLSGIALVLLESGYTVSGSDRHLSPLAVRVRAAGGQVVIGHRAENVAGADLVIRSSAIPDDNVEVQAALAAGIQVLKRVDFLSQLMEGRLGIAVAGTHGKTTTTAMIAWLLSELGCDPSFIIGGVSLNLGGNAHAGKGKTFVIEADEYDRMFLGLRPHIAVVTNVEHDHPDCYPTPADFQQAFLDFAGCLRPDGFLLACGDDRGAAQLLTDGHRLAPQMLSYGLARWLGRPDPDYYALNLHPNEFGGFTFDHHWKPGLEARNYLQKSPPAPSSTSSIEVALQVPGKHNVLNALAAMGVAHQLGLPLREAAIALGSYRGTGRRFEVRGEVAGVTVIDDYAHHPTEIRATLAAARARYPDRQLWAVWQPHTYSRTRTLFAEFASAFADADHVLVTEIYAAREAAPADGFSAQRVVAAMPHADARFTPELNQAVEYLLKHLRDGDILLVLSAGDADAISTEMLESLCGK